MYGFGLHRTMLAALGTGLAFGLPRPAFDPDPTGGGSAAGGDGSGEGAGVEGGDGDGDGSGAPAGEASAGDPPGRVEDLPPWAQKIIGDSRKQAGDYRVRSTKVESQLAEVGKALARALGQKVDEDEPPDPAALAAQLTDSQKDGRDAKVALATYMAADKAAVSGAKLLDSRGFMAKVDKLDPAADDFPAALATLITEAVTSDPSLKIAGRAPGSSGPDDTAGSGEPRATRKPQPLAQAVGHALGGNT